MLDKWAFIEEKLNQLVEAIYSAFKNIGKKATPSKVKKISEKTKAGLQSKSENILVRVQKNLQSLGSKKDQLTEKVKSMDIKEKVVSNSTMVIDEAKSLDKKKIMGFLALILAFFGAKWNLITSKISTNFIVGSIVVGSIGGITGINMYKSSQKIIQEATQDEVKMVDTLPAGRAEYYKGDRKHILVSNLKIPVFLTEQKGVRTLIMDFTFESSNRYIKIYIRDNEYEIRDRLLSTVEPIIPSFPLSQEGKDIIKDKIKEELNKFLGEKHIEGNVKHVYINGIIAG